MLSASSLRQLNETNARRGSTDSSSDLDEGDNHLLSQQSVELDQFTKVDRRQVVEELMMHDEVLAYLYDALFPSGGGEVVGGSGGIGGGGGGGMIEEESAYVDEGKMQQQPRSASGWRQRVNDTNQQNSVRMPQMRSSESSRSNIGDRIKLDPSVHEYLRQMSSGKDGLM